jgi:hypothetical protein
MHEIYGTRVRIGEVLKYMNTGREELAFFQSEKYSGFETVKYFSYTPDICV